MPSSPRAALPSLALALALALASAVGACATADPEAPALGARDAALTGREPPLEEDAPPHEPLIEMFRRRFQTVASRRFSLVEIDRPFRLTFDWWSNGTPLPSLFGITATSPSGAVATSGDLSANPILDYAPLPGETTVTLDVAHQSEAPQFMANIVLEQQILPSELGRCGDRVRDLFVRWANTQHAWRNNPNFIAVHEDPPSQIYFTYSGGVGSTANVYTLRGVLQGTHGPILQVGRKSGTSEYNTLLFFDEQGQLLHQLGGLYYFTLPDGNLLVSKAMADSGPYDYWYMVNEQIMAVSPAGDIVWERYIGGRPPGRATMTAAGTLVMSWWQSESNGRQAAIHEIDPRTGATVNETFADRSALCSETSTSDECLAERPLKVAEFEAWWDAHWRVHMSTGSLVSPRKACNNYGCLEASFGGWLTLGSGATTEQVMEVTTYYTSFNGSRRTSSLLFRDASGARTVGGRLLRRLGPDRLLVSTALADSGFVSGQLWYHQPEEVASVGPRGAIAWKRNLGAVPALIYPPGTSTTHGADGYILPDGRLFFTGWAMRNGGLTANHAWLDLTTGVVAEVYPPKRILEGVCVP